MAVKAAEGSSQPEGMSHTLNPTSSFNLASYIRMLQNSRLNKSSKECLYVCVGVFIHIRIHVSEAMRREPEHSKYGLSVAIQGCNAYDAIFGRLRLNWFM